MPYIVFTMEQKILFPTYKADYHVKPISLRFHEERIAHHQERIQYHKDAAANSRKERELARAQDGNKRLYMTSGKLRILFVDLGNVCRFDFCTPLPILLSQ